MFVPDNKNQLLKTLGLGYGQIVEEGCRPFTVLTVEVGVQFLNQAEIEGLISEEDATVAKQKMLEINMAKDFDQICNIIREYTIDEGFEPSYKFVAHDCCPYPLPHGIVVDKDGNSLSNPIDNLVDGFCLVLEMANYEQYHVLDAINIFKQMLTMDLPVDETTIQLLLEILPPSRPQA